MNLTKLLTFQSFMSVFRKTQCSLMASVTEKDPLTIKRLENLPGNADKHNDIILCYEKTHREIVRTVIFFGGDVQNYPEVMSKHQTNKLYLQWNLEETAKLLANRFKESLVIVVKPREMLLNTFSLYSNFVEFNQDGIPAMFGESNCNGLAHLIKLYENTMKMFAKDTNCPDSSNQKSNSENTCTDLTNEKREQRIESGHASNQETALKQFENLPISLVGFSKGCVPLNQLIFEFATHPKSQETEQFVSKIDSVYWLDSGHNGRKDVYITNEFVLQKLASSHLELFIHITPYQIRDMNRPWIGKEEKKFVQKLRSLKANFHETKHHYEYPGSLEMHFNILKEF